jgi:hypothetical protein
MAVLAFLDRMLLSFANPQVRWAEVMAQQGGRKFGQVRWKERRNDQRRLDLSRRGDLDRRDTGGPAPPDVVEQRMGERRQRQDRRGGERRKGDGARVLFGGISALYWAFALIAVGAVVLWIVLWYDHLTGGALLMDSPTLQDPLDSIKLK